MSKKNKTPLSSAARELVLWNRKAERALEDLIDFAQHFPALRKRAPATSEWRAGVRLVGNAEMKKLNWRYRKKDYPTDVLSFPAPEPFKSMGYLGELVVALPVLKRQAREHHHSPEIELWILLTHGLLHLLDMDHERGRRAETEQKTWEARLLAFTDIPHPKGLVSRAK
ncbi:MAG: rRNA maturation RNase YbeY [Bdellovibrionales bacterium]|nr:rRNA maturation RNase YbeY [Bdellovibrionales bacterium]